MDHPEDSQPEDHGRGGVIITIIITIGIILIIIYHLGGTGVCQTEVGSA